MQRKVRRRVIFPKMAKNGHSKNEEILKSPDYLPIFLFLSFMNHLLTKKEKKESVNFLHKEERD